MGSSLRDVQSSAMRPPLTPPLMTADRLRLMQSRLARQEPLAQPQDQPSVTESIRVRNASVRNDGDEIVEEADSVLWDRYFATPLGSNAARECLDMILRSRNRKS